MRTRAVLVALAVTGPLALAYLDWTGNPHATNANQFFGSHQFISAVIAELFFILLTYAVVDYIVEEGTRKKWIAVAEPTIMSVSASGNRLMNSLDGLATQVSDPATSDGLLRHQEQKIKERFADYERLNADARAVVVASPDLVPLYSLLQYQRILASEATGWTLRVRDKDLNSTFDDTARKMRERLRDSVALSSQSLSELLSGRAELVDRDHYVNRSTGNFLKF